MDVDRPTAGFIQRNQYNRELSASIAGGGVYDPCHENDIQIIVFH